MKILYLSYDGMTDPLGQSQVIPYLTGLSSKGYTITIVSCEKNSKLKERGAYIKNILKENNISWHYVNYIEKPPIISTLLNILRLYRKTLNLQEKNNFEIVHCRSYIPALLGLSLKKKFNLKFIFDMRGFWADERVEGNIWSLQNNIHKKIYGFFKRKEIDFLNHADYTIALTENAKDEIHSWKTISKQAIKIQVIPCCTDLTLFSQKSVTHIQREKLRRDLGITEPNFVLSYLGSIGTWYMLEEMLEFFKCLLKTKPNAIFLFITADKPEQIERAAEKAKISLEKIIIKSASREMVPQLLSLSSISIFFIKPSYSKKASSPTKMGEIMSMGIPLITNAGVGDVDLIMQKSESGLVIKDFSDESFEQAIGKIEELLSLNKSKIIKSAEDFFSLEKGVILYDEVYKGCMNHLE